MSFDLTNHMPIPYDADPDAYTFEEAGYGFKGWQPANDDARRVLVIQAFKDGELAAEKEVPMGYPNMFGIDVADMAALEQATEDMLEELSRT